MDLKQQKIFLPKYPKEFLSRQEKIQEKVAVMLERQQKQHLAKLLPREMPPPNDRGGTVRPSLDELQGLNKR